VRESELDRAIFSSTHDVIRQKKKIRKLEEQILEA
jgi:hypothetical protein